MFSKIFLSLLLSVTVFGQSNIISPSTVRTLKSFQNYVVNPDAEMNISTGVTDSSTITTRVTGATKLNGRASFNIDGTASAQNVKFTANLPIKYQGNNAEFSFVYSGTFSNATGDYKAYVENTSGTKVSSEYSLLTTSGTSRNFSGILSPGTTLAGPYYLVIQSTVAGPAAMLIDDLYVGDITSITSNSSITDWSDYTPTFTGFGTPTGVSFRWAQSGPDILIEGTFTTGTNTAVEARISLPNNFTSSSNYATLQTVGYGTNATSDQTFLPLMEASKTYLTFGKGNSGVAGLAKALGTAWSSTAVQSFTARVRVQGLSGNSVAAAASQTDYGWTSYTPTFTGFGTVSVSSCWHRRTKQNMDWRCKFTTGTPTAVEARISLPNSLTVDSTIVPGISISGHGGRSTNGAEAWTVLTNGGLSYITLGDAMSGTSPLVSQLANAIAGVGQDVSLNASFPITGWAENQRAPTLVGSITSNSSNAMAVCSAFITNAGTPAVSISDGSCVASVTDNGTGDTTANFATGLFSSTPNCTCMASSAVTSGICQGDPTTAYSSSAFRFQLTVGSTGAAVDLDSFIMCIGPR